VHLLVKGNFRKNYTWQFLQHPRDLMALPAPFSQPTTD